MVQCDSLALKYSKMIAVDPIKVFVQRPCSIKFLGSVENKLVLDVGCGDGAISRMLAKKGARVVGFDVSSAQIELAKSKSKSFPQIEFFNSSPECFQFAKKFDCALAVMVIDYLKDFDERQSFFDSVFALLKSKGKFVVMCVDVEKLPFGINLFDRVFTKLIGGEVKVDFVVPNTMPFSAVLFPFSKKQVEGCAKNAGFKSVSWKTLVPSSDGKKLVSSKYWANFKKNNYWIAAVCQK